MSLLRLPRSPGAHGDPVARYRRRLDAGRDRRRHGRPGLLQCRHARLQRDIAWTTELCEFMMVWATFLGGASRRVAGRHMTITEFLDKLSEANAAPGGRCHPGVLPGRPRAAGLVSEWASSMANWGNVLTVLDWPMALQYLGLPVGSAAMLVFVAFDLIQILRGKSREERYGG